MDKEITLVFHNHGLRSYIEVDLCQECPRQDDKGCCGYYSPVFYLTDMAFLLEHNQELLDYIFSLERLTVLDASVTVNSSIEGVSYRCRFHSKEGGCLLTQLMRESICRHFVCAGIGWWEIEQLKDWRDFFAQLTDYEIELNNLWAEKLRNLGLSLRDPLLRPRIWAEIRKSYHHTQSQIPQFIADMPATATFTIKRPLKFGADWIL